MPFHNRSDRIAGRNLITHILLLRQLVRPFLEGDVFSPCVQVGKGLVADDNARLLAIGHWLEAVRAYSLQNHDALETSSMIGKLGVARLTHVRF